MDFHFFGHGKVMENQCEKRIEPIPFLTGCRKKRLSDNKPGSVCRQILGFFWTCFCTGANLTVYCLLCFVCFIT